MKKAKVEYHDRPGGWYAEIIWPIPNKKNDGNVNSLQTRCYTGKNKQLKQQAKYICKQNVEILLKRLELEADDE